MGNHKGHLERMACHLTKPERWLDNWLWFINQSALSSPLGKIDMAYDPSNCIQLSISFLICCITLLISKLKFRCRLCRLILFWLPPQQHKEVLRPGMESEPELEPIPQLQDHLILIHCAGAGSWMGASTETSQIINPLHDSRNSTSWFLMLGPKKISSFPHTDYHLHNSQQENLLLWVTILHACST